MKLVVAIVENQGAYARLLMEYMNQQEEYGIFAIVFTDWELYLTYESEHKVDILLTSVEWSEARQKCHAKVSLTLSEEPTKEKTSIFKYQSADCILQQLLECFMELGFTWNPVLKQRTKQKVLGVFTPVYQMTQTKVAWSLAKALSGREKCLYLCLQPYFITEMIGSAGEHNGVSDVIYLLKQQGKNQALKIKQCIEKVGELDYLVGTDYFAELFEISAEELKYLLSELLECLQYDSIVIDFSLYNLAMLELMKSCEILLQIQGNDEEQEFINQYYCNQLKKTNQIELLEHIHRVRIPTDISNCNSIRMEKITEAKLQNLLKAEGLL